MFQFDEEHTLQKLRKKYVYLVTRGPTRKQQKYAVRWTFFVIIVGLFLYAGFFRAPSVYPEGAIITLSEGSTLTDIADQLEEKGIVRSAFWLKNIITFRGGEKAVFAGDYFFETKKNVFLIARRITAGDFDLTPVAITIPEGTTNNEMALLFAKQLSKFDKDEFLTFVEGKEGYLFPDTYLFLPNTKAKEVVRVLDKIFAERIGSIRQDILRFGKPLTDVVIMASLLEKEARTTESRRIIAGILWKRLEIGMLLQVDAVFGYILGKGSLQLTQEDLSIDSPYNTYRYKGLPIGPIANPGLDSLQDAVTPILTDYLFYLSDKEGTMHYSETFEEHKRKKRLYLN